MNATELEFVQKIIRENEALRAGKSALPVETPNPAMDPRVVWYAAAGNLINAIKRYRELTGLGLKESKDAIDAMIFEMTALTRWKRAGA